jgi:hypothetical protein
MYKPQPVEAIPPASITAGSETSLLPLDKGNQWTYAVTVVTVANGRQQPASNFESTWRVTDSQQSSEGTRATIEVTRNGKVEDTQEWLVSGKGIYQLADGKPQITFKPPMPVVVFPLKDGATFKWSGSGPTGFGRPGRSHSESIIRPSQEVDTDMGRISAIPVESRTKVDAGDIKGDSASWVWFAPGTGVVRLRQEAVSKTRGYILVLKLKSKSLMKS